MSASYVKYPEKSNLRSIIADVIKSGKHKSIADITEEVNKRLYGDWEDSISASTINREMKSMKVTKTRKYYELARDESEKFRDDHLTDLLISYTDTFPITHLNFFCVHVKPSISPNFIGDTIMEKVGDYVIGYLPGSNFVLFIAITKESRDMALSILEQYTNPNNK